MIVPSRRRFLALAGGLIAAPAIVRFASLMPVRAAPALPEFEGLLTVAYELACDGVSWNLAFQAGAGLVSEEVRPRFCAGPTPGREMKLGWVAVGERGER